MTNVQRAVLAVRINAELQKRGETISDQAECIQQIIGGDQKIMNVLVDLESRN
ncbi:MAG: hypothetical protein ACYCUY_02840 [Acidithiobacillus sp.]